MIRRIIQIDETRCNGCGLCVNACHEGALALVDGKARLVSDVYCDGMGDCLPACPQDAIHFVEREAGAYDEAAVQARKAATSAAAPATAPLSAATAAAAAAPTSELGNWPVQIKLLPLQAPYFDGADLLIAADCCAYACGDFHARFIKGRVVAVGCPKLDAVDYSEKLAAILSLNNIRTVVLTRMQVPCCGGMERAVRTAIALCGKEGISLQVVTFNNKGDVIAIS